MAARKRKIVLTDDWKAKIKAGNIMHRLHGHVMGTIEMTASQIKAAQVVLSKLVPDLARTELTGAGGGPVQMQNVEMVIVDAQG